MKLAKAWRLSFAIVGSPLLSQTPAAATVAPAFVAVGSTEDSYLRYLQTIGLVAAYPWSIRGFSPHEMERLGVRKGAQPWSVGMYPTRPPMIFLRALPTSVTVRFNSTYPYGSNDGAIWAGRGLTTSIETGFELKLGPISAIVNPIAFRAENRPFQLIPNGRGGNQRYADAVYPGLIDRPQRFGSGPYSRVDPGQSTVRIDLFGLAAGASTADMGWGPMQYYEYITGGNAPGIPHVFFGTGAPVNVGIGRAHAQVIWGRIDQSDFSPVHGTTYYSSLIETGTKRFASGLVGVFQPRGIDGLEIGAARFFHSLWPREGIPRSYFTKPFSALLKKDIKPVLGFSDTQGAGDNQLASVFARWALSHSGFEVYTEYGHEDHNYNLRDLIEEPDHSRILGLGARKVISSDSLHLSAIRAEMIDYGLPTLARNRPEGGTYLHGQMAQGHTNRGQVIGADAGVGTGGGLIVAWDSFSPRRSFTITGSQTIIGQTATVSLNGLPYPAANTIAYALGVDAARIFSNVELGWGVAIERQVNRTVDTHPWNLNTSLRLTRRSNR
jgi:hypothetical protein